MGETPLSACQSGLYSRQASPGGSDTRTKESNLFNDLVRVCNFVIKTSEMVNVKQFSVCVCVIVILIMKIATTTNGKKRK